ADPSPIDRGEAFPFDPQSQELPMTKTNTNGFQPDIVAAFVDRIELLQAELKEHTEGVRDDIAAIFEEASDHEGIPKKALKMVLRERALRHKLRDLPADQSTAYRQLCDALADLDGTELGEAAKTAINSAIDSAIDRGQLPREVSATRSA